MAYPGTEGAIDITLQDDWLYYVLDCSLYRMRTDGTHNQLLTEVSPYDGYRICEEGIFFTADISTRGYRHKMIRCDLDGGNPTLLLHEPVHSVSVLFIDQGYVYFRRYYTEEINGFQGEELCRMRLDGTEYQIITRQNDLGGTYQVRDGWIYYTHSSTDRHLQYTHLALPRPD